VKPVTCEVGVERLMDYLEDIVPGAVRIELETHVDRCALCQAFIASYRETPRIVREATEQEPTAEQRRALLAVLASRRR